MLRTLSLSLPRTLTFKIQTIMIPTTDLHNASILYQHRDPNDCDADLTQEKKIENLVGVF